MPIGWFIVPYKRRIGHPRPIRYCAIDDESSQIHSDGGEWAEVEVLGDQAVVKVRASAATFVSLATKYKQLPEDGSLSNLSPGQKIDLRNELVDAGYGMAEIQASFGNNMSDYTLQDVLHFMASRRLKPRYDPLTDEIVLDGPEQGCGSLDDLDRKVN